MIGVLVLPLLMGIHNSLQHGISATIYADARPVPRKWVELARIFPGNSAASLLQAFIVFTCQNLSPRRIAYRWSVTRREGENKIVKLIPSLDYRPSLFAYDRCTAAKTMRVLAKIRI
jgi:hypothetical protein